MDILQSVLLAGLYSIVAAAVWRSGLRFPALFVYCAVSVLYQFIAVQLDAPGGWLMLALLILAGLETAWWAVKQQEPGRLELVGMLSLLFGAIALALDTKLDHRIYLSSRTILTCAAFCVLVALNVIDLDPKNRLNCTTLARINLRLMCAWMGSRAVFAATYDLYPDFSGWSFARWLYVVYLLPLAALYIWRFEHAKEPS